MNIVNLLSRELDKAGIKRSSDDILFFSKNAPNKYRVYSIPKRTAGLRTIAHPSKELKIYQRILSKHFQTTLPIHDSAFAYRQDLSIKDNAEQHKSNKYLLKMDFENFFNSINPTLLKQEFVKQKIKYEALDLSLIEYLCFWSPSKKKGGKLVLSVGAPVSPVISNFIMYRFDTSVSKWCTERKITYSRYADDISFSCNIKDVLFQVPAYITEISKAFFDGKLSIKPTKTVFSSKGHNRHITGVTINNNGELSIGRARKRYISSLIHKYTLNVLSIDEIEHMKGLLGFAFHIEPIFKERMIKKYTHKTIDEINQFRSKG